MTGCCKRLDFSQKSFHVFFTTLEKDSFCTKIFLIDKYLYVSQKHTKIVLFLKFLKIYILKKSIVIQHQFVFLFVIFIAFRRKDSYGNSGNKAKENFSFPFWGFFTKLQKITLSNNDFLIDECLYVPHKISINTKKCI